MPVGDAVDTVKDELKRIELHIVEGFTSIKGQHDSLSKDIAALTESQSKVFKSIYGNGVEGLLTRVAKIEQRITLIWSIFATIAVAHLGLVMWFAKSMIT